MCRTYLLFLACCLLVLRPLAAQNPHPGLRSGDEVRVRSEAVSGRYLVHSVDGGTLLLQVAPAEPPIAIPLSSVERLDVNRGPRPAGQGMLRGAGYGLLIGGTIGAVAGYADGDDRAGILTFTKEEKALVLGVVMGAAGTALGGIVGLAAPGERWERVPNLRGLRIEAGSGGAVAVVLSRRF